MPCRSHALQGTPQEQTPPRSRCPPEQAHPPSIMVSEQVVCILLEFILLDNLFDNKYSKKVQNPDITVLKI